MKRIKRVFIFLCCFSLLSSHFVFSADAFSISPGADGWTNVTTVDLYSEYRPTGSPFFNLYNKSFPFGYGFDATYSDTFTANVIVDNSGEMNGIVLSDSQAFKGEYLSCFYQGGVALLPTQITASYIFRTADGVEHRVPAVVSLDPETGFRIFITIDYTNTTGADLIFVGFSFDGPCTAGGDYWASSFSFRYKITSSDQQAIEDQTEQQKGFFQNLGDRISGFFDNLGNKIGGFFTDLANKIGSFFDKLLTGIIDGLKSLFIPADVTDPETGETVSYFDVLLKEMQLWAEETFGFLYQAAELLVHVLNEMFNLEVDENPSITFPGLVVMDQTILEPIEYNFETLDVPWLNQAHDLYLFVVDVIIGYWLVVLASRKFNEILGDFA